MTMLQCMHAHILFCNVYNIALKVIKLSIVKWTNFRAITQIFHLSQTRVICRDQTSHAVAKPSRVFAPAFPLYQVKFHVESTHTHTPTTQQQQSRD